MGSSRHLGVVISAVNVVTKGETREMLLQDDRVARGRHRLHLYYRDHSLHESFANDWLFKYVAIPSS